MSDTIRINTTPNGEDKYIKIKIEQDFDFIKVLSLKLSQEEVYRKFCSDYGVIVGRVNVNSGFGVPNAKVSVFIPLDEVDKNIPEIKALYPYEIVTSKNSEGVRYNLLPKIVSNNNPCHTPIGTFPPKREVLDNDLMLKVFTKYYKFTTTTNYAGDFMIFGVPLGNHIVHVDADISDIGIASQRPYDLISQGTPKKLFESSNKFKGGKNLDKLPQIKTFNIGVNVQPFWGDIDNYEIGITRVDFDLNHTIIPSAIFMGSIYGDQDKHSVNKKCRPRKKLGELCEQVTSEGTINMIRKTLDNTVEEFDIDGGRLIDQSGAWAYQIPMNLDYIVTDEEGNLIFSDDPNIGIPTRARVRFKIGMDETGGEGRLRTRAKYLVPNNPDPNDPSTADYNFDDSTQDNSFKDLYWNKIYTVSNYIPRFQTNDNVNNRSITGIKDVDGCSGVKNPFPYNKVNTELNPIFSVICILIRIVTFIVFIMNRLVIPLINALISVVRVFISGVCSFLTYMIDLLNKIPNVSIDYPNFCDNDISYIPCIAIQCPDGENYFAPGCIDGSRGLQEANATYGSVTYYFNSGDGFGDDAGLSKCLAIQMAKTLNIVQFDFYNDWVNGSLFSYLLKYKKKRKNNGNLGTEKFCEYECRDGNFSPSNGVDSNDNGIGDNKCSVNFLGDTCFQGGNDNKNKNGKFSRELNDGLIKKVGDEFFYAAGTHYDGGAIYKLFATDIICLGSIFDCDWQGIPKINQYLIPTTYKIPSDIQEIDGNNVIECGMIGTTDDGGHLFFDIDCIGVHVDYKGCLNIKHICEFGVDIDEAIIDPITGNVVKNADCIIGDDEIDNDSGKWFRDVFYLLNKDRNTANSINLSGQLNTNFNLNNDPTYNFSRVYDSNLGHNVNGSDYVSFRGYDTNDDNFGQTMHSYYFYFGLIPGQTALDKLNNNFFNIC